MRRLASLLAAPLAATAVAAAVAAAAGAAAPAAAMADVAPLPASTAGPAPIALRVSLENPSGQPVDAVIAGGRLRVVGTVRPYVAGEFVFVRAFRHGVKLDTRGVPVVAAGGGAVGRFSTLIGVGGRAAPVSIRVSHPASPGQAGLDAPAVTIPAVRATLAAGQAGAAARLLQHELSWLHYAVPHSGRFDDATARAVIAFRKLTGLARTAQANRIVFERLGAGAGGFHVRYPGQGAHFEGDLTHQVLAEVLAGGRVRQIFEMSSGKPSTPTVIGNFQIYMKTFGVNEKGMVDANYFVGGYAIHGYPDVPIYPASHGCLRIPVPDAPAVYAWARFGYPVDVYYRTGGGSRRIRGTAGP